MCRNLLTTYWLARVPGAETEGPFTLGQIRKMYDGGAITADGQLCRNGEEEWTGIDDELAAIELERAPVIQPMVSEPSPARIAHMRHEFELGKKSEGIGMALSFFLPLGGQFYTRRYGQAALGIALMCTVFLAPVVWIATIVDACFAVRRYNEGLSRKLGLS